MIIKPECDVENAEDFSKYYNNTFMETRDGRILKVSGHHGSNVVLRDYSQDERSEEAYTMFPWRKTRAELVYGRPASCLFTWNGRVYAMRMNNNRQAGRGFRADYYSYVDVARQQQINPLNIAGEADLALAVYRPVTRTLTDAATRLRDVESSLLSRDYALCYASADTGILTRRWDHIGMYQAGPNRITLKPGFSFAEPYLREELGFTGGIKHEAA